MDKFESSFLFCADGIEVEILNFGCPEFGEDIGVSIVISVCLVEYRFP